MKKATLNLKEMPGKAIGSPVKKEKKRAGLAWLWSKIKAPFVGATGGDGAAGGLASSASRAGGVLEEIGTSAAEEAGNVARGAEGLAEEAGSLSQQFDELASRVAARVGAEASPWVGKAIMAAVAAGVVGTGILAARHFAGNSGSFKSPYGAIASGINAHPSGPNSLANEAPTGSIGAGENTTAGANTTAGKAATTPNTGKATAVNIPTPPGGKAQNPGSLAMPSNTSFGGGAPVEGGGAAPQYAAQAAQEAAMAKNAIAWKPQASVSPMSIRGGAMNVGSMGFRGGKAFNSGRTLAALRSAVGYNAGMNGASYSGDAQNAINQFDNQMTSGGGISQGGVTTGSADSANSVGGNTPAMMGGSGSGSGSNTGNATGTTPPVSCDISVACNAQQIAGGGVADATTSGQCTCSNYQSPKTEVDPWQKLVNQAKNLLLYGTILAIVGAILCASGWPADIAGWIFCAAAIGIGIDVVSLAGQIGPMGGHYQGLITSIEGYGLIAAAGFAAAGAAVGAATVVGAGNEGLMVGLSELLQLFSFGTILTIGGAQLLTPGGQGTHQTLQSNLQVDDSSMQNTESQINTLQAQINSDQSQITADQANLAQEEALPQTRETRAQIAQDNAQINADNTQIGNDQNQISNTLIPNLQQEISQTQSDTQQNTEQVSQLQADETAQQAIINQYNGSNGQTGQLATDQATLQKDQQAQANEAAIQSQIAQDESQIYKDDHTGTDTNPTQVAADQTQLAADQATLKTDQQLAGQIQSAQNQVNSDNTAIQNANNQLNVDKQQVTTDNSQAPTANTDITNAQNLVNQYLGTSPTSSGNSSSSSSNNSGNSSSGNSSSSSSSSNNSGNSSGGTFIQINPNGN
jgi:hypothetical protein